MDWKAVREVGKSQSWAEQVGVSTRYIQNVEAGEYLPSLPALVRLRGVLRCDWNELFAGCDKV